MVVEIIRWDNWKEIDCCIGQRVAKEHGLILVDTKYEFGKDKDGNILVIDEMHTPDSSR